MAPAESDDGRGQGLGLAGRLATDRDSPSPLADEDAAVLVRKAYKEYRSKSLFRKPVVNPVIQGLDMTVRRGTIYGLLGASGCGKTTILKSIVGKDHLTSGEVRTLGRTPGVPGSGVPGAAVGYMPQELALYIGFTIGETFRYFGWLTGVPREEIAQRTATLLKFLDLPSAHCMIGQLSGGQQRRVSFAVALLHQPPLLILDEPTVGVDPVLRQRIWDHLMDITADGMTTVIITTHYIEEARQAHALGLMRQGVLLAEDAPDRLLERYHCSNMEEVFLKLSVRQARHAHLTASHAGPDASPDDDSERDQRDDNQNRSSFVPPAALEAPVEAQETASPQAQQPQQAVRYNSLRRKSSLLEPQFTASRPSRPSGPRGGAKYSAGTAAHMACLLWKHMLWMRRNLPMVAFLTLLPVVQCMLFGMTVGRNPKGLKLAVSNEEGLCGDPSLGLIDTFNCSSPSMMSCRYMTMLKELQFETVLFGSLDEAKVAVRQGKAWAAVYFPANFTSNIFRRVNDGQDATNESLVGSEVNVWLDNSNSYITTLMQTDMSYGTIEMLQKMLAHCDYNPAVAGIPVRFETPVYGIYGTEFLDFAAPGCVLTLIFFMSLASAVGAILSEKNEGLLDRSLVMGVTMREVMWSHIIVQTMMMILQTIIVLVGFLSVLKITNDGPLGWVVLLCVLQGFCGMCLGMLVSSLTDSDREATFVALGSFFPLIVLSGMMWPIEGMHPALRSINWALPLTLATTSLRYMMARGWSPEWGSGRAPLHPEVVYGFLSTVAWIIIFLTSVLFVLRTHRR